MFRDMTGNTKFARCEGCGEPIFDRWGLLASMSSAITIFLVVSQTIFNQLDQVCDAAVRQFLARGLSLLFTGLTYLPLSSFWWFFNSNSRKSLFQSKDMLFWVLSRYSHSMTFWTSVSKSQRHVLTFSPWYIFDIFWKSCDNVLHIPSYHLFLVSSVKFETFPGKANFLPQHSEYN